MFRNGFLFWHNYNINYLKITHTPKTLKMKTVLLEILWILSIVSLCILSSCNSNRKYESDPDPTNTVFNNNVPIDTTRSGDSDPANSETKK